VLGNLVVAGRQAGLSGQAAREKAMGFLQRFDLEAQAKHYPPQLSGGQRQRVAIAQQFMCSEHFLLMDEPFSGLDPVMKDEACRIIAEVAGLNELTTIIVVTHDIGSACQVADHLWLMGRDRDENGNIIPGAYLKETVNLIERGLAWHPDVTRLPEFDAVCREVREKFDTL
jgi:polar amino acid transport system ATP-binding protein/sulfate transport system ATP-binding protein